jgi:cyanophycinase
MKKLLVKIFAPLFALLLLTFCSPEKKPEDTINQPQGSLFIIGGGPRPDILAERMVEETGLRSGGYIVILPMASEEPDSAIIWSGEQFAKQGITAISGFNLKSGEPLSAERIDSLSKAALIFISGGDQSRFMNIVRDTPIHQAIIDAYQNGAMIAGTSAGAAMMSQKMITGDQKRHLEYTPTYRVIENENIELADGLGLLNTAIIDQHFVWRSRHNRLITAVLEFPELPGIGIDESTAILVKGNTAEVVGVSQIIVFRNPNKSRKDQNEKMGGYGLTLDVFLPGDKFEVVK